MYKKIVIVLLLADYVPVQSIVNNTTITTGTDQRKATGPVSTPAAVTGVVSRDPHTQDQGRKPRFSHQLSETEITLIVLAVIAGIVGIIVGIVFAVRQLMMKRALDVQPLPPHDTDVPLSSIETGIPEN